MAVRWRGALKVGLCFFLIQRQREHGVPIDVMACIGHSVVDVTGMRNPLGNVSGVGGDARGNDALFDVAQVGQAQVLGGGDVA